MANAGSFSQDQREFILKQLLPPEANEMHLGFYLEFCKAYGYDPRAGHVYASFQSYKDKQGNWQKKLQMSPTVDGLRLTAEKTGRYEGQVGPYWCGEDGQWVDVWLNKTAPSAAKVGVLKTGFREPLYAVATWESYKQTTKDGSLRSNWQGMPDVMLAKAAESLALRKAFPEKLADRGLASAEERTPHYAELEPVATRQNFPATTKVLMAKPNQFENEEEEKAAYVYDTGANNGWSKVEVDQALKEAIPEHSTGTLPPKLLSWFVNKLETHSFSSFVEEARQAKSKTIATGTRAESQAGAHA